MNNNTIDARIEIELQRIACVKVSNAMQDIHKMTSIISSVSQCNATQALIYCKHDLIQQYTFTGVCTEL